MARRARTSKTNALRELDRAGISYELSEYDADAHDTSRGLGVSVARELHEDVDSVFKTLVCVASDSTYVVCCIPVATELDLKHAAQAAHVKSLAMLPLSRLEAVTGYVRGGCSPVGMRHQFPTIIDETAILFERIGVSAGRRGLQIMIDPEDLAAFCNAMFADITREGN